MTIRQSKETCLVLYSGSGIPESSLRKNIEMGIEKVKVATEAKNTFTRALKEM